MSKRLREWRLSRARAARMDKPAAPPDPTEKFAKEAHDLDAIRKSVEDAAAVSAGFWLSYLFVLFYIAIAAGAVTHRDLLLENPVKLPFLSDVPLPLVAFFFLAPIVFIVSHAYTLVHFVMLAAKVGVYDAELLAQLGDAPETREGLRRQLPSNIFVQFLAGPGDIRKGGLGWLLKAVAWISLVIGPVLLLLSIQVQFLPYHLEWVTWVQRFAVLADVILLWLLWPAVLNRRSKLMWRLERRGKGWPGVLALTGRYIAGLTACLIPLGLAFTAATFPGEWLDEHVGKWEATPPNPVTAWLGAKDKEDKPIWTSFHDLLFNGKVDDVTRRRKSLFSNTLVLPGFAGLEAAKIDDPKKLDTIKHTLILRGRHLEGAVFNGADLHKADLEGAQLQGASLRDAQFQGALLDNAQLQDVFANFAELQGASLVEAQLQGAILNMANLQGASLRDAQLQGASFFRAQLQGTDLDEANLQGASLDDAQLQSASLEGAQLQGAALVEAQLQGAYLSGANLQGVSLAGAQLQGASFFRAQLQGASLERAQLAGAALTDAFVWRARFSLESIEAIAHQVIVWDSAYLPFNDPEPWTEASYLALKKLIEKVPTRQFGLEEMIAQLSEPQFTVPQTFAGRDAALKRIAILDPNKSFEFDAEVPKWKKKLEAKAVGPEEFEEAFSRELNGLARELKALACSGDANAVYVVRGMLKTHRDLPNIFLNKKLGPGPPGLIENLGTQAPGLVEAILKPDCPVSAALTEADKAALKKLAKEASGAH
jgi:uncharacterized protein YjbI with pentapeptide repeats